MTGPQAEKFKEKMCEIFRSCGLKITIKTNLHITDFLDVNFNLKKMTNITLSENQAITHYTLMLSQTIQKASSRKFLIRLANVSQKYLVTNMKI